MCANFVPSRIAARCLLLLVISAMGTRFARAEDTPPKTPVLQVVEIIFAKDALPLEQLAAKELVAYITRLSDATVELRTEPGDTGKHLILLGSPATNPALKKLVGDKWPKLSNQGIYLKSIPPAFPKGRDILIVGGGSPVATLWAVHELAERWGVVHLLSGDNFPDEKQLLSLRDFDVLLKPEVDSRTWRTLGEGPESGVSWSLEEQKKLIAQLARLKFNRLDLELHPEQPFLDYSIGDIKKNTGVLWQGEELRVDGDTPGRDAFAGAKVFENPDLPNSGTYDQRVAAGVSYVNGIIDAAHGQGMRVGISLAGLEFPLEFKAQLADVKTDVVDDRLIVGQSSLERAAELAGVQLLSARKAFAKADQFSLRWRDDRRPQDLKSEYLFSRYDSHRLFKEAAGVPDTESFTHLEGAPLLLSSAREGVLAQLPLTVLAADGMVLNRKETELHFSAGVLGELDAAAIFISRAAFNPALTPQLVSTEIFATLTGQPDSAERTWRALVAIDELTQLAQSEELNPLVVPDTELFARLYKAEPLPAAFEKMVTANGTTTTELYRARSNCLKRGSNVLYYYAKRGEYVGFYLSAVKALREAATAKAAGDKDLAIEKLEVALEAVDDALSTYGDVAQNPSDRGLIALLAARLYRPLVAEYEQMLDAAESKE
jgi:hypothetical protein